MDKKLKLIISKIANELNHLYLEDREEFIAKLEQRIKILREIYTDSRIHKSLNS